MSSVTDRLVAGRYRLARVLGRGGMADVYEAFDERLARNVAVKMLRPEVAAQHPEVIARFEAEARSAARLSHPNVVAIFDTGEHEGRPYIVMEQMPGETLAEHMARGPVDLAWLRRVAGDVLGALAAAHAAGIVHRDIKPGNILIGADGCAKVADFGIAKSLDAAAVDLTGTNSLVGTPAYMAPERVAGEPATAEADIYGLGVVLYEGAAGQKPFTGPTPVALAYAIRQGGAPPVSELRPDIDRDFADVIGQAMALEPAFRFASAGAMANALGVTQDLDTTVPLVPAGPDATMTMGAPDLVARGAPAAWWARRQVRVGAAVVLVLAVLVAAVLVAAGSGGGEAKAEPPTTAPTIARRSEAVVTTATPPRTAGRSAVTTATRHHAPDSHKKRAGGKGD